jgi:hypothetical protein
MLRAFVARCPGRASDVGDSIEVPAWVVVALSAFAPVRAEMPLLQYHASSIEHLLPEEI